MSNDELDAHDIAEAVHQLKTPITAVKGFLDLIAHAGELNATQKQYMERAMTSLDRMADVIRDLNAWMQLTHGDSSKSDKVDLAHVVGECAAMVAHIAAQDDITLHIDIAEDAASLNGDGDLLAHAITNLLSNAIKYNRHGGAVWVTARRDESGVHLSVRDDGIGIAEEEQSRVFDHFFRASHRHAGRHITGNGLGLAVTQRVIAAHGGRIWVESVLNSGTTFHISLPDGAES